jgi:hypothetical protein
MFDAAVNLLFRGGGWIFLSFFFIFPFAPWKVIEENPLQQRKEKKSRQWSTLDRMTYYRECHCCLRLWTKAPQNSIR